MPSDPDGRDPRRGRNSDPRRRGGGRYTPPGERRPGPRAAHSRGGRRRAERRRSTDRQRTAGRRRSADSPQPRPRRADAGQAAGARQSAARRAEPGEGAPQAAGGFSAAWHTALRHPAKLVVALVSALALVVTGFAWQQVDSLRTSLTTAGGLGLGGGKDGAVDILMVGIDSRTDAQGNPLSQDELDMLRAGEADATNTDTMILIRIPNDGSSATAVSIPRDSYVDVPGLGMSKINAAYGVTKELTRERLLEQGTDPAKAEAQSTDAGRQALVGAVADLTGITVDHYAEVGLLGFVLLTNAVGGVPVCLNAPVDDPYSGAQFPAGTQTLNGADALSFVRQRHGLPRGDLDRIVRQQSYLASLAHEVLSADMLASPSKLNELNDAVHRSIVVDSGWDVIGFARRLQDLSAGAVTFRTIPVQDPSATSPDGESIVQVDPAEVHSFFTGLVGGADDGGGSGGDGPAGEAGEDGPAEDPARPVDVTPGDVTVDILNSSSVGGLASSVSDALGSVGYTAGRVANYSGTPPGASEVRTAPGDHDAGLAVARALGGLEVRTDDTLPPGTVSVVLSGQYTGPGSDQWSGTLVSGVDGTSGAGSGASGAGGQAGQDAGGGSAGQSAAADPSADPDPANPVGPSVSADGGPRCVN